MAYFCSRTGYWAHIPRDSRFAFAMVELHDSCAGTGIMMIDIPVGREHNRGNIWCSSTATGRSAFPDPLVKDVFIASDFLLFFPLHYASIFPMSKQSFFRLNEDGGNISSPAAPSNFNRHCFESFWINYWTKKGVLMGSILITRYEILLPTCRLTCLVLSFYLFLIFPFYYIVGSMKGDYIWDAIGWAPNWLIFDA